MILVLRADPHRYVTLQAALEEGIFLGRDKYLVTVTTTYELLQKTYSETPGSSPRGWLLQEEQKQS